MRPTIEHRTNRAAALRRAQVGGEDPVALAAEQPPPAAPPVAMADNLYSIQRSKLQQRSRPVSTRHRCRSSTTTAPQHRRGRGGANLAQGAAARAAARRAAARRAAGLCAERGGDAATGRAPSAQLLIVCQRMDDLLQTLIGLDGELQNATLARRARIGRAQPGSSCGRGAGGGAAACEPRAARTRARPALCRAHERGSRRRRRQHRRRRRRRRATTAAEAASASAPQSAHAGAGARARGVARAVARGGASARASLAAAAPGARAGAARRAAWRGGPGGVGARRRTTPSTASDESTTRTRPSPLPPRRRGWRCRRRCASAPLTSAHSATPRRQFCPSSALVRRRPTDCPDGGPHARRAATAGGAQRAVGRQPGAVGRRRRRAAD